MSRKRKMSAAEKQRRRERREARRRARVDARTSAEQERRDSAHMDRVYAGMLLLGRLINRAQKVHRERTA